MDRVSSRRCDIPTGFMGKVFARRTFADGGTRRRKARVGCREAGGTFRIYLAHRKRARINGSDVWEWYLSHVWRVAGGDFCAESVSRRTCAAPRRRLWLEFRGVVVGSIGASAPSFRYTARYIGVYCFPPPQVTKRDRCDRWTLVCLFWWVGWVRGRAAGWKRNRRNT